MTLHLPTPSAPLKIGTRGSPLALAQAHETRTRLMAAFDLPEAVFDIIVIKTSGDNRSLIDADRPLKEIGNKGLFTKEIEEAMLAGTIDIGVHSMKDMPVEQPSGLVLDTFLPRQDPRDTLVSINAGNLAELPSGAIVGTSSLRRRAQVKHRRDDLNLVEFRGNLQTRLKKLHDNVADATFLAMAGLIRLNMSASVPHTPIEVDAMLPAVAQGAIGIERRTDDLRCAALLEPLHHKPTALRLTAERAFLAALDGSCDTPIAGLAELDGDILRLRGEILRPDGSQVLGDDASAPACDGAALGQAMAAKLRQQAGAGFFTL